MRFSISDFFIKQLLPALLEVRSDNLKRFNFFAEIFKFDIRNPQCSLLHPGGNQNSEGVFSKFFLRAVADHQKFDNCQPAVYPTYNGNMFIETLLAHFPSTE